MPDINSTRQHFESNAKNYNDASLLQQEVAKRLSERLDYIKLNPHIALDIGCGTGYVTKDLLTRYPKANVIASDISKNMVNICKKHGSWLRKPKPLCGDAEQLPFKADVADLLISNLMLQWTNDLAQAFIGFNSVLAPNGLLLFTTFGPDTLQELHHAYSDTSEESYSSTFDDMHEIGDALLQAGFINPVMDMEMITMTYKTVEQLLNDIKVTGINPTVSNVVNNLTDKKKQNQFVSAYEKFKNSENLYPATYEIVYGHAWVGEGVKLDNYEKVIPIQLMK